MENIINTAEALRSRDMEGYLDALCRRYHFLQKIIVGKSVLEKEITAIRLGVGEYKVIYVGAHHGLEWMTSLVLLKYLEEFCHSYEKGNSVGCFDVQYLFQTRSIFILPMLNPDGVDMAQSGKTELAKWQSNARGVDLNHNYDAGWIECKKMEQDYGIMGPGPTRYGGIQPESEPETAALCAFCRKMNFSLALALHSQGEEIYYDFGSNTPRNSLAMATIFSAVSGYQISKPDGIALYGGFKDWFIQEFSRPAFTIEVGKGKNPLPLTEFDHLYPACRELLFTAALV